MIIALSLITLIFGIFFLSFFKNKKFIQFIAIVVSGLVLLYSIILLAKYDNSNMLFTLANDSIVSSFELFFDYKGIGSLTLALDNVSIYFFFLSAFLIFLCIIFIWTELKFKEYAICLLLVELFLLIIFSTYDLFFFYVFFEAILVPMYLMIGLWGSRERKIRASYLFFFYTLGSSLLMLIAIIYIYSVTGSLNMLVIFAENPFTFLEQLFLWITFFLSFASKIPMFPFHIWLPEAHVEAPTVGSVLLAGILLKLGVYGFLRFSLTIFSEASLYYAPAIWSLAAIGVIFASLAALRQTDLKRIIAYSSIAHMNLVVLGIFSFNSIGIEGAILQSLSHGFVSGGLFLLIGILYNRYHSRFLYYYGGLVHFMPIYSITFLIFTLANIALPGTSSFVGEFLLLNGVYVTSASASIVAALGVILSGSYSLWLFNKMTFGNVKSFFTLKFNDMNYKEFLIMLPLFFFIFFMGLFPNYFLAYMHLYADYMYLLTL